MQCRKCGVVLKPHERPEGFCDNCLKEAQTR